MLKKCLKIWPRSQQVEQVLPGVALEPMDSSHSTSHSDRREQTLILTGGNFGFKCTESNLVMNITNSFLPPPRAINPGPTPLVQ